MPDLREIKPADMNADECLQLLSKFSISSEKKDCSLANEKLHSLHLDSQSMNENFVVHDVLQSRPIPIIESEYDYESIQVKKNHHPLDAAVVETNPTENHAEVVNPTVSEDLNHLHDLSGAKSYPNNPNAIMAEVPLSLLPVLAPSDGESQNADRQSGTESESLTRSSPNVVISSASSPPAKLTNLQIHLKGLQTENIPNLNNKDATAVNQFDELLREPSIFRLSPTLESQPLESGPCLDNVKDTPGRSPENQGSTGLPINPPVSDHARQGMEADASNSVPEYILPRLELYPSFGFRNVSGKWPKGKWETVNVRGKKFLIPVHLLVKEGIFKMLAATERPKQGWVFPRCDPKIFGIILESALTINGFDGTEGGINLVSLALAAAQCLDWNMETEAKKLISGIRKYLAKRAFYINPHDADWYTVVNQNHYVYRSEDLYRSWKVVNNHRTLSERMSPSEILTTYSVVIPEEIQPALTTEFCDEFNLLLDISMISRSGTPETEFLEWWVRIARLAGVLEYPWMLTDYDCFNAVCKEHERRFSSALALAAQRTEGGLVLSTPDGQVRITPM